MPGILDVVQHCLDQGLTFAAFRWRGDVHLWVERSPGLARSPIGTLDDLKDVFIVAPFERSSDTVHVLRPDIRIVLSSGSDVSLLEGCKGTGAFTGEPGPVWDGLGHAQAIDAARQAMAQGQLSKVVLARTMTVDFPGNRIPELFVQALIGQPRAFVCLLNAPELGTWLGASPERLIQATGDVVTVDAIAGTMPAENAPTEVSSWGTKERHEQELVTMAIRSAYAEQGMSNLRISGPKVLVAGPVAHLHSGLEARLGTASLPALVHALHPTPAVCGTPTDTARAFIRTNEPHDRRLYAGFWGPWQVNGCSELFVNIRCLQAFRDKVDIHVGGGITAGSSAVNEWRETEQKARTWLEPIQALKGRVS